MKDKIKEVLAEFYAEGIPDRIVHRDLEYVEKLLSATVVKGMRRTGKTYVTYERIRRLLDEGVPLGRIVQLNFEDDRLSQLTAEDLRLINEVHAELQPEFSDKECWYFLDELQNVKGWESYARRLVDSPRIRLCLTGSSSKLLGEEIATQMRGRSLPIEVFPLSFSEFMRFNSIPLPKAEGVFTAREKGILRKAVSLYLEQGGFPDVVGLSDRMRATVLQGYVDAVLYRDVLERHEIASVQALKYTLEYLIHNFARKASARAISGVLKNLSVPANRESVMDYIGYFKDAYLVYPVPVRSDSLAVRRVNPDKYYIVDTGLVRAVCAKTDVENGWLLENLVFMSLRRRFCKIDYYLTEDGREVDFEVLDKVTRKRSLVQVTWSMADTSTFVRESSALESARRETGIDDCTIVTWDDEDDNGNGIRVVPIWKWLLECERGQ